MTNIFLDAHLQGGAGSKARAAASLRDKGATDFEIAVRVGEPVGEIGNLIALGRHLAKSEKHARRG